MTETTTKEGSTTITPVEPEKSSDIKHESKVVEVSSTNPEGEITVDSKPEEEAGKVVESKEELIKGYLSKKTPKRFVKIWGKYYFVFGSDAIPENNLRLYFKKNVKSNVIPTTKVSGSVNATTTTTAPTETETLEKITEHPKVEEESSAELPKTEVKTEELPKIEEAVELPKIEEAVEPPKIEEAVEPPKTEQVAELPNTEETKEPSKIEETKEETKEEPTTKIPKAEGPAVSTLADVEKEKEAKDKEPEAKESIKDVVEEPTVHYYKNIAHAINTGKGLLFYYKSAIDASKQQPLGIINLKEAEVDDKPYDSGRLHAFKIKTSYRTFELSADSKAEKELWIRTINEKIEEAKNMVDVESSEKYKDAYKRLDEGTCFLNVKSDVTSDSEMFSDEENDHSRNVDFNKRRSVFNFFRKPSNDTNVITQSETRNEDGTQEVTTTTTTEVTKIITTEENLKHEKTEEVISEEGSPKSTQRASLFPFSMPSLSFGKRGEKSSETKEVITAADDVVDTEEATNAETSNAAITAEVAEENKEKQKKWNINPFKKSKETPKEDTSTEENSKEETAKEVTNAEHNVQTKTNSVETPAEVESPEVRQKEHKEIGLLRGLLKGRTKDEPPHETKGGETTTEATKIESTDVSAEDTTPEPKNEGTVEKATETSTDKDDQIKERTLLGVKLPFGKSKHEKHETDDKAESKPDEKKIVQEEPPKDSKESDKKEVEKKDKKEVHKKDNKREKPKKDKKKEPEKDGEPKKDGESKKEGDEESSSSSSSSDSSGGKGGGVVRRVTQIWRRNKSQKADSAPREETTNEAEEIEGKKEAETSTEKVEEALVQTDETKPESSNVPTEEKIKKDDEKKKEKSSIFENLKRISSGIGKRQNSLPQEPTQEKVESTEPAAVASASEATDVDNAEKIRETTIVEEKEKESESAVQKPVIPEGKLDGNLHKQSKFLQAYYERRYFVLHQDKLSYYRSEKEASPEKSIDLSADCKVKIYDGKHFFFDLDNNKGRIYKLYADSEEERDSWIKALEGCGVTSLKHEKDQSTSDKKTDDVSAKLEVANSETNLQEEVVKAADAAAASVSETQDKTTKSTIVETKEGTEITEETTVVETEKTTTL